MKIPKKAWAVVKSSGVLYEYAGDVPAIFLTKKNAKGSLSECSKYNTRNCKLVPITIKINSNVQKMHK